MIACPASDPGFADHPLHGVLGQHALFSVAMRYCTKFRVAIDVGAHIGLWSGMLGNTFDTVYAYEPVGENYDCLLENMASFNNVRTQRVAIGHKQCAVNMELPANGNSGCWYFDSGWEFDMLPLDLLGISDVDFIKIDVEGAEGFVIAGALLTIRREKPVIVFENNGLGQKHFGDKWVDPKPLLTSLGYRNAQRVKKDEIWIPC